MTSTGVIQDKEKQALINTKRISELDNLLLRKRKELETINSDFENVLKRQGERLDKQELEFNLKVEKLKLEVKDLEERKKIALVPLDSKWKEIEQADKLVKQTAYEVAQELEDIAERQELLEDRLTEVADRELNAKELAKKQLSKQKGIDQQAEQIKLQAKSLNDLVIKTNLEFKEKEKRLKLIETKLLSREKVVTEKENGFKQREKELDDRDRQIRDRYQTLEQTLKNNK